MVHACVSRLGAVPLMALQIALLTMSVSVVHAEDAPAPETARSTYNANTRALPGRDDNRYAGLWASCHF